MIGTTLLLTWLSSTHADEGMWLPEQLPALSSELAARGLKLPAEQLADPLGDPLGAIIHLNGGCSASFVSPDGLVLTNHHCVEGYLQFNSDEEHDLAGPGFHATGRDGELWAGPLARMYVVEQITDVTDRVRARVDAKPAAKHDARRALAEEGVKKELVAECERQPHHRCTVSAYDGGGSYRLVSALEIRDVRLVFAPPSTVGNYGGEIDNWMWPRHAGDFAVLRAWVGPDGKPADHAEDNVPYHPAHFLEVNPAGASPGDFVMVAGYPGGTDRYALSAELGSQVKGVFPTKMAVDQEAMALLEQVAAEHPETASRLVAPVSMIANGTKYRQGILDALEGVDILAERAAREDKIRAWAQEDPKGRAAALDALDGLTTLAQGRQATAERDVLLGRLEWFAELLSVAHTSVRFAAERKKPDLERDEGFQDRDLPDTRAWFEELDQTWVVQADRAVTTMLLKRLAALPADQRVPPLDAWIAGQGGLDAALDRLYRDPALATSAGRLALLHASLDQLRSSEDPWVELAVALEPWLALRRDEERARRGADLRLRPAYMDAVRAVQGGPIYPDANDTLRVTYGRVEGMSPADGLWYLPQTTTAGMAAKATGEFPFDAPQALLDRVPDAAASRWADPALGDVPVNFLTTLDTTGGNSGSATLDAEGRLVGLIFDGTYESIVADWAFLPAVTRSIHLDVRYLAWILDGDPELAWVLDELVPDAAR